MEQKNIQKDTTLVLHCYEQLQSNIIDGTYAPGEKLKVEQLKKTLAVGSSPIREALSRLVASGLVETEENKGFRVARISQEDVRDIFETFFHIEALAISQAIKKGGDAWEASIVAALYQLGLIENKKGPVPYTIWAERNLAFHIALISGCNSPMLLKIRSDIYNRFDRYCRIAFNISHENLDLNHEEHKKLADAVLQRDEATAIAHMKYHILGSLEQVIQLLKTKGLL